MKKTTLLLVLGIVFSIIAKGQDIMKNRWIDSVYQQLSLEQRFGQLLMVRANLAYKPYDTAISRYIRDYGIGGLCFFSYDPIKQIRQTNRWQQESQIPLLMSIDAEWGLGMRHRKHCLSYPYQMTLGAVQNDTLIYKMAWQIGEQCKRMGLHMNFAPVVDVNNNPNNPVINVRSFGDSPTLVAQKAAQYMRGLQDVGLLATAKHFPGHGDTDTDSHKELPVIPHHLQRLKTVELAPFQTLIAEGLGGIMIAHLYVPALEREANVASSLSKSIVTDLLKEKMGFHGLVVTDGLDMRGITKHFAPGEIECRAFLAGNDILLLPPDVPKAIKGLCDAYKRGEIMEETLAVRCKKILGVKYELGLYKKPKAISEAHLLQDLNAEKYKDLRHQLFDEAITLLKNEDVLPLQNSESIAVVNFGSAEQYVHFKSAFKLAQNVSYFYFQNTIGESEINTVSQQLAKFDKVIFNFGNTNIYPQKDFGIDATHIQCAYATANRTTVCINVLANPIAVQKLFKSLDAFKAVVLSYQDNKDTQLLSAKKIIGKSAFKGRLPISINNTYVAGSGVIGKLEAKGIPVGRTSQSAATFGLTYSIDSLVKSGIEMQAFPGCQIFVKHKGEVLFNKSYGYLTYDSVQEVDNHTLYDLASLTKVLASAPALMYLYQLDSIDLDRPIVYDLPQLANSNKAKLCWRDILSHQAGLQSWIPFYKFYIDEEKGEYDTNVFSKVRTNLCSQKMAPTLYINPEYHQAMYDSLASSPLYQNREYVYSDLGYYWVPILVQKYTHLTFEDFLDKYFYHPLGLENTFFRPLAYVKPMRIAPTENDKVFRQSVVKAYVHDPGAAMLGGVSGHAGLFSNAEEVAKIFELYLNKGLFEGRRLLSKQVLEEFTKHQFPGSENRRALCFDKPYEEYDPNGPCCEWVSQSSFGHSGFTGTYVWADPEYDLIYVFLSNRSFPNADNFKISHYNFRTDIQAAIYKFITQLDTDKE